MFARARSSHRPSAAGAGRRARSKAVALLLLAALLAAGTGCASMQQRVTESENRSATLEAQVADLQAAQQTIIARVNQIRQDLENALDPVRAQQASGGADLRTLETEVAGLREQVALLAAQLEALSATAAGSADTPPQRSGMAMPPPRGQPSAEGAEPAPSASASLFNAAYADYTAGQYVLAVSGFEELLVRYPGDPRGADALYWIGESLAAQERHDEARRRFLEVPQRFPASPKVPDAVLRAALEAVELGQRDDAIRELRQLIAAHGGSDAALIGCMQLDRMGQTLPAGCRLPS